MVYSEEFNEKEEVNKFQEKYATRLLPPSSYVNKEHFLQASKSPDQKVQAQDKYQQLSLDERLKCLNAVKYLQKNWRQKTSVDTLISVNPHGFHDATAHLINGVTQIKKNVNKIKRNNLINALHENNWLAPILNDEYILEIAMAAFVNHEINFYQMETLIGFYEASFSFEGKKREIKTYPILQADGELTEAAKSLLWPAFAGFMKLNMDDKALDRYKKILRIMTDNTPSENMFYSYQGTLYDSPEDLQGVLYDIGSLLYYNDNILHHSASAYDAFRIAAFGWQDSVPARVMLGVLSPADIERTTFLDYRPKIGFFPRVKSSEEVHGYRKVSHDTKSDHDNYHADLSTRLGYTLRNILNELILIIRTQLLPGTGKTNAAVIWNLVDREFRHFNYPDRNALKETPKSTAEFFCKALLNQICFDYNVDWLIDDRARITDSGIVCFIDMATRLDYWKTTLKFYPELMLEGFKDFFDHAVYLLPFFTQDTMWNILIYRTYLKLENKKDFPVYESVLKEKYDEIKSRLSYKRNNKIQFLGIVEEPSQASLHSILPEFLKKTIGLDVTKPLDVKNNTYQVSSHHF